MSRFLTLGGAPPFIVAGFRGAVEVGLLAIIGYVIDATRGIDFRQYVEIAPLIFGGLRAGEGFVDELIDPGQNRTGIPSGAVANYFKGIGYVGPAAVGFLRSFVEVGVLSAIGFGLHTADSVDWGQYTLFAPAAFFGLRWLEGFADQFIDPKQNRRAALPLAATVAA